MKVGIAYGYLVRHGGIGRLIKEILEHTPEIDLELITLKCELDIPNHFNVNLVNCKRDTSFMSLFENVEFSKKVSYMKKFDLIHTHGIYHFMPDLYTANICMNEYFNAYINYFGKCFLPKQLDNFKKYIELEKNYVDTLKKGRLTCVSKKIVKDYIKSYSIEEQDIEIIPCVTRFKPKKGIVKQNQNKQINVGFVGSDYYFKGFIFMKDVMNDLVSKGYEVNLYGAGYDENTEKKLLENAKYNLHSLGKVDLKSEFYNSMDIFINLSVYDTFSLACLESMTLGTLTLSSLNNGIFDEFKDENILCVSDVTNYKEISDLIEKSMCDLDFQERLLSDQFKITSKFNSKKSAKMYVDKYNQISY